MVPEYKAILDKIMAIMAECHERKLSYVTIESAAAAMFELETSVDKWDIGKTPEQIAKDSE